MGNVIRYTGISRAKKTILYCCCSLLIVVSASSGFAGQKNEATDQEACQPNPAATPGSLSLAAGDYSQATGNFATAVGGCTRANAQGASAFGYRSEANQQNATAIGQHSKADSAESLAVGSGAIVDKNATNAIAIGSAANVGKSALNSMAIGSGSNVSEGTTNSIAVGAGAKALNSNSVALGAKSETSVAVATTGTKISDKNYHFAGINPEGTVSFGSKGKEKTLTNLAAGRVDENSTDGVNGSQLSATNAAVTTLNDHFNTFSNNVTTIFGGGSGVNSDGSIRSPVYVINDKEYDNIGDTFGAVNNSLDDFNKKIDSLQDLSKNALTYDTNTDGTRTNHITPVGGDPNAPVALHNIADGKADADAVNLGQLKNVTTDAHTYADTKTEQTLEQSKSYTDTALKNINQHTDEQMSMLSGRVDDVQKEAREAAAVGLAASSLRYDDRPGKLSAAIGGGAWQGEGAFAAGLGYTSENQRIRLNISAANAGQHWGMGGGVSYTFN